MKLKPKKKEKRIPNRREEDTIERIELLEDKLLDELIKVSNMETDIEKAKDNIMFEVLKFSLAYCDENTMDNYCWRYFKNNRDEHLTKIP